MESLRDRSESVLQRDNDVFGADEFSLIQQLLPAAGTDETQVQQELLWLRDVANADHGSTC